MQAGRIALGVLAALGAIALVLFFTRPAAHEAAPAVSPGEAAERPAEPVPALVSEPASRARRSEASDASESAPAGTPGEGAAAAGEPAAPSVERVRVTGLVVDPRGAPLAGVGVGLGGDALATSALDGAFELELRGSEGRLVTADARFATLRASRVRPTSVAARHLVVAAPAIEVAGRVVDESGNGVEGAGVLFDVPDEALRALPYPLDTTDELQYETTTRAGGAFRIEALPAVAGALLRASKSGFESANEPLPRESASAIELVLRAPQPDANVVTGVVFHADGEPAWKARVHFGDQSARTDANGRFRLALGSWVDPEGALVATLRGFQPAVKLDYGSAVQAAQGAPPPVSLFLGGEVLAIRGHVQMQDGSPCAEWKVELVDATPITRNQVPASFAESFSADRNAGKDTTDASGTFVIDGLSARQYALRAWDPASFVSIESEPIEAGAEDVLLRVPADALCEHVCGRVTSPGGDELERVAVSVRFVTARSGGAVAFTNGAEVLTDARGRFELARVPRRGVSLDFGGESVVPASRPVEELDLDSELAIVVRRRCHFRVLAKPTAEGGPSSFALEDEGGREVPLHEFQAFGWGAGSRRPLEDGTSKVLTAGEGRYRLVLFQERSELARRELVLEPGEVQIVDAR